MITRFKKLLKREYSFLNRIEISRSKLLHNYAYLSSLQPNFSIAPVLKSNAYGHGLVEVAQILDQGVEKGEIPFLCVDSLHEAYRLYNAHIKLPILIMGYFDPENLKVKKLPFHYVVWDLHTAKIISQYQKGAHIHIKVDTGMHRLGVQLDELEDFITQIKNDNNLTIVGLMSHFAYADNVTSPLFINQVKNFEKAKEIIKNAGVMPKWFHIAASNALLNPQTRDTIFRISNLARTGKGFYGIAPFEENTPLQPALTLKTKLAQIKRIKKNESIGYDGTYTAKEDITMGVLPIGYNDGIDRRLSNKGFTIVNDTPCPIIGRVSMNITTIDISKVKDPQVNQEVIVYADNPQKPNSINNSAKICDTIAHELLIHLESSTKRIIVD